MVFPNKSVDEETLKNLPPPGKAQLYISGMGYIAPAVPLNVIKILYLAWVFL